MQKFQERKRVRGFLYSPKIVFILALGLGLIIFFTAKVYPKSRDALLKNEETQKELTELKARKEELEKEVAQFSKESGVEEMVRKNLDVQKPGEKVAVIIDKNQGNGNINTGNNGGNFLQRFWEWIKSKF